ncbi:uncharacterized protein PAC_16007 [Phialocephala subalpina]|uniref:Uncharacterized protein n=1 Tax=Phialocephala subalpina TaxID=576137 RepID=A0A1L7XMC9_9HELO|nr:uncharacterized protein PAC_16007 [Phialocephala subalpina]
MPSISLNTEDMIKRQRQVKSETSASDPNATSLPTEKAPSLKNNKQIAGIDLSQTTNGTGNKPFNNNMTNYLNVPRGWPTWPASGTFSYGHTASTTYDASWTSGLGPMNRWEHETPCQGPWSNTAAVAAGEDIDVIELEEMLVGTEDEMTDAGSWWPSRNV